MKLESCNANKGIVLSSHPTRLLQAVDDWGTMIVDVTDWKLPSLNGKKGILKVHRLQTNRSFRTKPRAANNSPYWPVAFWTSPISHHSNTKLNEGIIATLLLTVAGRFVQCINWKDFPVSWIRATLYSHSPTSLSLICHFRTIFVVVGTISITY